MHLKLWTEFTVWHFISLMLNFHYLWSGNPAANQSHLIIYCQDVSYWPSFSLSKHCKTLSQRHTSIQMHTHTHPAISLQSTVTNLLCIPATNDQLQATPILKRPRDQRHSSKASFLSCFLLPAEQFEDIDLYLLRSDEMKWEQGELILFTKPQIHSLWSYWMTTSHCLGERS